ncbi:MAG: hypothetical protein RL621_1131 [Bacteroidota bacterium]
MALNQNGGIFVVVFRFSEKTYGVTQDGEAVEKEKNRRLVWSRLTKGICNLTVDYLFADFQLNKNQQKKRSQCAVWCVVFIVN